MSNFICSECGMTNIDCGYAGYKTPKEIELEKRLEISEKEHYKTLQQLRIATKALKEYSWGNNWLDAGCRGQLFLPTKRGYSIADRAIDEMEGVK